MLHKNHKICFEDERIRKFINIVYLNECLNKPGNELYDGEFRLTVVIINFHTAAALGRGLPVYTV